MSFDSFRQNTPSNTLQKGGGLETDHRSGRCEKKFPYETILASWVSPTVVEAASSYLEIELQAQEAT
jgi:hypothetical protein